MNRLRLFQNVSNTLLQVVKITPTCSTRGYRFGRRVNPTGYYVSPLWFDEKLLELPRTPSLLNNEGVVYQQNKIFDEESTRQKELVTRIEKIEVQLEKPFPASEDYILMMNSKISTPYDCAAHINRLLTERSALALIDGTEYYDMHRPLEKSCHLRLLHCKHPDTMPVNQAFWRSCSMLLGSVLMKAFKDDFKVKILSQPMSDLQSGSFVCDVNIEGFTGWQANTEELRSLTSLFWEQASGGHRFERLEVNVETTRKLFEHNQYKLAYIESEVSDNNRDQFIVYRVGDHVELSDGPMISNTSQINSIYVTAIHPLVTSSGNHFYRVQGIALPKNLHINAYAYGLIRERAAKLNRFGL